MLVIVSVDPHPTGIIYNAWSIYASDSLRWPPPLHSHHTAHTPLPKPHCPHPTPLPTWEQARIYYRTVPVLLIAGAGCICHYHQKFRVHEIREIAWIHLACGLLYNAPLFLGFEAPIEAISLSPTTWIKAVTRGTKCHKWQRQEVRRQRVLPTSYYQATGLAISN